jgi:hypothetical protein
VIGDLADPDSIGDRVIGDLAIRLVGDRVIGDRRFLPMTPALGVEISAAFKLTSLI